jgi:hypothetical protein
MAIKQMSVWPIGDAVFGVLGHKQSECKKESYSDHGDDSSSESDMENDNKDENHVDDQENDMTNNSKTGATLLQLLFVISTYMYHQPKTLKINEYIQ